MKPFLLIPIVAGMLLMPSTRALDAPKPRTPADLLRRSYSLQERASRGAPSIAEIRAAEYAVRYTAYDSHHETMQPAGHSGVAAVRPAPEYSF